MAAVSNESERIDFKEVAAQLAFLAENDMLPSPFIENIKKRSHQTHDEIEQIKRDYTGKERWINLQPGLEGIRVTFKSLYNNMKTLCMKFLQLLLLERDMFEYTKTGLSQQSNLFKEQIGYRGTDIIEETLYFLSRRRVGKISGFNRNVMYLLYNAYCEIVERFIKIDNNTFCLYYHIITLFIHHPLKYNHGIQRLISSSTRATRATTFRRTSTCPNETVFGR